MYEAEFNRDEAEFACYLDELKALRWWHRNVARPGNYSLQGWRRHRVIETKGDQLQGLDTSYKKKLLESLTDNYRFEPRKIGDIELITKNDTTVI